MSELHFVRIRQRDSKDPFCDPAADIKAVAVAFAAELPRLYQLAFNPPEEKIDYLRSCLKVFQTRLAEDYAPMQQQMEDFEKAMRKVFTAQELWFFLSMFARYALVTAAMHYRRDAKVDKPDAFRMSAVLLSLSNMIPADCWSQITSKLPERVSKYLTGIPETVPSVSARCVEDESKSIPDIKDIAAQAMGATGDQSWEEIAAACDKYVVEHPEDDSDKAMAIALAYPDYETPYFEASR